MQLSLLHTCRASCHRTASDCGTVATESSGRARLAGSFHASLALGFNGVLPIEACVRLVATGPPGLPGRSSHTLTHR